jgi:DNA-binding transcriptional LysR family regulator
MIGANYRYFYAIAQERSIRKAADRVHVSPSAMSRQLGLLEDEIGHVLLERRPRGVVLTPAGKLLVEHIRRLVAQERELKESISELGGLGAGHIRAAVGNGFAASVSRLVIPKLAEQHPSVTFSITVASNDEILRSVEEEIVDLGVLITVSPHPFIQSLAVFPAPLLAVLPVGHRLAGGKRSLELSHLESEPLALLKMSHGIRQTLQAAETSDGVRLTARLETNSYEVLKNFVAAGLGLTILPRIAVVTELRRKELVVVPINHPALSSATASIITRKGRKLSATAADFAKRIEEELSKAGS